MKINIAKIAEIGAQIQSHKNEIVRLESELRMMLEPYEAAKTAARIPQAKKRKASAPQRKLTKEELTQGVLKILEYAHSGSRNSLAQELGVSTATIKGVLDDLAKGKVIEKREVQIQTQGAHLKGHLRKVQHWALVEAPKNGTAAAKKRMDALRI